MRRHLLVGLGLVGLAAFWISACQSEAARQAEAHKPAIQAEAAKFLATLAVPNPETQQTWGMSEFHIIGMGPDWAVQNAEINPAVDAAQAYDLAIHLWCIGKSPTGEELKLRRTLCLKALTDDNGVTWRIESPEFRNDQPLTFLRQLLWWLFGTFVILPLIFCVGLGMALVSSKAGCLSEVLSWGAGLGVIVAPALLPAVLANAFFDSVIFTVLCLVVSILITIRVYKALP